MGPKFQLPASLLSPHPRPCHSQSKLGLFTAASCSTCIHSSYSAITVPTAALHMVPLFHAAAKAIRLQMSNVALVLPLVVSSACIFVHPPYPLALFSAALASSFRILAFSFIFIYILLTATTIHVPSNALGHGCKLNEQACRSNARDRTASGCGKGTRSFSLASSPTYPSVCPLVPSLRGSQVSLHSLLHSVLLLCLP